MTAPDRIFLLAIDLTTAPADVRTALHIGPDELTALLDGARSKLGDLDLAIVSTAARIELYSTAPSRQRGFQELLREAVTRGKGLPGFGATRVIEISGVAAVRHLMRLAAGLESTPAEAAGSIDLAAQAARLAQTLGDHLGALFASASGVTARVKAETTFDPSVSSDAEREVAIPEVERIVEEEVAAWQAYCVQSKSPSDFPSESRTTVRPRRSLRTVA